MSRKLPPIAAPTWSLPDTGEQSFTISVVTPLFGGGYRAREVDTEFPIRAAAARGHLRFWWRATAGAQCKTAEELFIEETKLWGSDKEQGKVSLHITVDATGEKVTYTNFTDQFQALPALKYALFPFQRNQQQPEASCLTNVRFTLRVGGTAGQNAEVKQAIHAWIKYGGIGARTRRGCGSLCLISQDNIPALSLQANVTTPDDLTLLCGIASFALGPEQSGDKAAIKAWAMAVQVYNDFRQRAPYARNPGPGRSKWPEPDSIRLITGNHYSDPTGKSHKAFHTVNRGFPRADLGLPIIFHFKDYYDGVSRYLPRGVTSDPADATLEGSNGKLRFASPVITKALQTGKDKFRPLVLVLNAPHVWHNGNLTLTHGRSSTSITPTNVSLVDATRSIDERGKVAPLGGQSIRDALLQYATHLPNWTRGTQL